MGWEYDGDEDAFWAYANANSPKEENYPEPEYDYLDSSFLDKFYTCLRIYLNGGQEDLDRYNRIPYLKKNGEVELILNYLKEYSYFLHFDDDYNKIWDQTYKDDWLSYIQNKYSRSEYSKIDEIIGIRNELRKRIYYYFDLFHLKDSYPAYGDYDINKMKGDFNYQIKLNHKHLRNEPSMAIKVLTLAYGSKNGKPFVDSFNKYTSPEERIERVATKLHCESSFRYNIDGELRAHFKDGSSFIVSPIKFIDPIKKAELIDVYERKDNSRSLKQFLLDEIDDGWKEAEALFESLFGDLTFRVYHRKQFLVDFPITSIREQMEADSYFKLCIEVNMGRYTDIDGKKKLKEIKENETLDSFLLRSKKLLEKVQEDSTS